MSGWDLNDKEYDVKDGGNKIFNNGVAGIVENNTAVVEKKGEGAHEKAPDYKIVISDTEQRTTDVAFWYPKSDMDDKEKGKYMKKLGHVARCFLGAEYKFPSYKSGDEMLDKTMMALRSICPKIPVRVLMTFGNSRYPKDFPGVRSYPRFIEPMSVNLDDSKLSPSDIDLLERPTSDESSGGSTSGAATADTASDDWD